MAKKYYWLKLKEDFFNQKEIKKLRKIAGGDTYTIIYLKMQLLSLKNGGILKYEGTEDTFSEQLALEIDEDIDNIEVTLSYLNKNNLIEISTDSSEYLLVKAANNIGKEGDSAERVRRFREKKQLALHCNGDVTKCNTDIEIDIDKEIELDKEQKEINSSNTKEENTNLKLYEELGFGLINMITAEKIKDLEEEYSESWVKEALLIADDNGSRNLNYVKGILSKWKINGKNNKPKEENKNNRLEEFNKRLAEMQKKKKKVD